MSEREKKMSQCGRLVKGGKTDERSFARFRQAHVADEDTCKALNSVI
jgi:hypothetical protein